MKSSIDQQLILFEILSIPEVLTAISGSIYQDARPNADTEDIVILGLPVVGNSKQQGQAIINIYVPDVELKSGSSIYYKADSLRLNELLEIIVPIIKSYSGEDFNLTISRGEIFEDADKSQKFHYYSLKISFEFFNL